MRSENVTSETGWGMSRRVLLVDKEIWSREGMAADLGREGCDVFTAANANDAIQSLYDDKPEVVIIDLTFPGQADHSAGTACNELLVLSWLQGNMGTRFPFIVISSDGEKHRDQALEAGALDFLQKPVSHETLMAAIERAIHVSAVPGQA